MRTDPLLPRLSTFAAAAALAGCAVGPDYRAPGIDAPFAYHGATTIAARAGEAPAPALDAWWQGFDDPVLARIVERALAQNLDLAASRERVAQARAVASRAGAARLPEATLDAALARERQSLRSPLGEIGSHLPGYERTQTLARLGVGASWEADLAGGLRRGEEAADAELAVAEAQHAGVRVSLAAEAADAYLRARGAQSRIAIAQRLIDDEGQLVDLVRLRRDKGLGSTREVAQAEGVLLQAQASVPPLRRELASQLFRLDVLTGATPGSSEAEVIAAARDFKVPAIATAGGPAELLRRRPDVVAAERRLAASNARIGVAIAGYYPSFSLSGVLGFESLDSARLLTSPAFQPAALAGLHWRLFDFGRVDAEVAQARGANREALLRYRQAMLRATEDVEDAIVAVAELESQHALLEREVDAHLQARDAAQDAYRGGAVSLVEVLDEDRQLLAAQDLLASVRTDDARAAVSAFRALGGGWTLPPAPQVAAR
ncbi:MAG TPA: efflux transporter outer membrane subunit [Burkholderiaceae bacterium]